MIRVTCSACGNVTFAKRSRFTHSVMCPRCLRLLQVIPPNSIFVRRLRLPFISATVGEGLVFLLLVIVVILMTGFVASRFPHPR